VKAVLRNLHIWRPCYETFISSPALSSPAGNCSPSALCRWVCTATIPSTARVRRGK